VPQICEVAVRRVLIILTLAVGLLTIAGVIAVLWNQVRIDDPLIAEARESLVRLFRLDGEANVPTWFSSSLLLASAALLGWIAANRSRAEAPFSRHWWVLAFLFLCMSLDETAQIHEMSVRPSRHLLELGGALHFTWVVPAGVLVLVFFVAFLRFLRNLPAETRRLFLLSGTLFVAGALGMESVSALYWTRLGESVAYGLATTTEEFLEMAGIVVFLKALMEFPAASGIAPPA